MDKDDNYTTQNFAALDYDNNQNQNHHSHHQSSSSEGHQNGDGSMVNYLLNNLPHQPPQLSFADVMQFADFGPKLALNQTRISEEEGDDESGIDPVFFLKFPVLNEKNAGEGDFHHEHERDHDGAVQLQFLGEDFEKSNNNNGNPSGSEAPNGKKRKRPRSVKTSEEVESQRMTHIAVERNRRKQMNEHLRVLRSLMPGSYVQRGDQASIIGGAIEFVRELEQLLQCLESQKRRRLLGDPPRPDPTPATSTAPFFAPNDDMQLSFEGAGGIREESAESKSCLADVEVKLLGFDAMIKILSRRRPGQLVKAIAALEDLQFNILHTNITTIEQTVLYSFNVKVTSESRFSAEDIASSVQQIFSFIHANTTL